jgi:hypothetical protein
MGEREGSKGNFYSPERALSSFRARMPGAYFTMRSFLTDLTPSTPRAIWPAKLFPGKNARRLFHDEIIPDGFDPFDAACDLACLIDGFLRINEAAQLNDTFAGLYADLK